ncbi:MAG: hypothetical protein AAFO29_07220, partial [Actinomycetota bacterium]
MSGSSELSSQQANPLIDGDVVGRALEAALGGGADFAEVFAEDAQRGSVNLDDGRIESLASGR